MVAYCKTAQIRALIDIDPARFSLDDDIVSHHPDMFAIRRAVAGFDPVDPRQLRPASGEALARFHSQKALETLCEPMVDCLAALIAEGIDGFRLRNAGRIAPAFAASLLHGVRERSGRADILFMADVEDFPAQDVFDLSTIGFDFAVMPVRGGAVQGLSAIADYHLPGTTLPIVAGLDDDDADAPEMQRRVLAAAAIGGGWIVPVGLLEQGEFGRDLTARAVAVARKAASFRGEIRSLTGPGSAVAAFLRSDTADIRQSQKALMTLMNCDAAPRPAPDFTLLVSNAGADFDPFQSEDADTDAFSDFAPGEIRILTARRAVPVRIAPHQDESALLAANGDRLVLQDIRPTVEDGDFAVKRVVGENVTVEATLFADGHEQLGAELWFRAVDEPEWQAVRMEQLPNDLWRASFTLRRLGRYEFFVDGWLDRFAGFRRDFAKKLEANVAQPVDFAEGRALVDRALARSEGATRDQLSEICQRLDGAGDGRRGATLLLSPELTALMDMLDERPHRIRSTPQRVDAERLAARFSSWYELFPRSQTDDPHRHGTFADVIARLPAIRAMGFDTLYFPPIHPIGLTNRKGPNNSLTPGPDDPGSPYAIGAPEGGHDAIHPELGSFEDFARLIMAAQDHGLEIALDFAIQCSPDHPWLREHPGWFAWRPDGSMKYAENPPKKYQDIVNVDFYGPDAVPGLWLALRDVVLLWVGQGVKTFRVDNPHTKPLSFWEWMIDEVRGAHPDVIFLAEAFTRPAMMYRLAKVGFSQSYTYFTWRNEKAELADYITELTTTAPKEFYRPHLFVNTPDINPPFLQTSGRPGFRIRAVLAATLSGLFGVYSGFELCEAAPVPGKEEYLDSEKYEIRPRNWNAPGNIIADITMLNRLRRHHPALQTHLNTRFHRVNNDRIIYYAKPSPDGADMILVMVSMDPHNAQEADFDVPLWEFGLPDDGSVAVEDLAEGHRFHWYGKIQHIRLDPEQPYRIWRIAPGESA